MFSELWKLEILTGSLPAKTSQYSDRSKRKSIIELYDSLKKIQYIAINKQQVYDNLKHYPYMLQILSGYIEQILQIGWKEVKIVYFKSNKLKFEIRIRENRILMFIPFVDDEGW